MPLWSIVTAFVVAVSVGLFFGVWPALKAPPRPYHRPAIRITCVQRLCVRLRTQKASRTLMGVMNDRIVIDPNICHGKPVIRGTRTPVAIVVGSLAGGMSFEEVQREYDLTMEDIRAALKFASELVDQEQHHPLPA